MPPSLISKFAEVCFRPNSDIEKVAIGVDIRGGRLFNDLIPGLDAVTNESYHYSILFLDAQDEVLLKRYKETRRSHPLSKNGRIGTGILLERELLTHMKQRAHFIIDTSNLLTRQLKEQLQDIFVNEKSFNSLIINVISFGFKPWHTYRCRFGVDVRFIPNPFYIQELKEQTGNNQAVKDYVLSFDMSNIFLDKLKNMLDFLIPHYVNEGKNQLVIAIGCTGGKHRSVTLANELVVYLQEKEHAVMATIETYCYDKGHLRCLSSQVKAEIVAFCENNRHCRIAELCAIVNGCGVVEQTQNTLSLHLKTENRQVKEKYQSLLAQDFSHEDKTTEAKKNSWQLGLWICTQAILKKR